MAKNTVGGKMKMQMVGPFQIIFAKYCPDCGRRLGFADIHVCGQWHISGFGLVPRQGGHPLNLTQDQQLEMSLEPVGQDEESRN
jgi:hypothetical protein